MDQNEKKILNLINQNREKIIAFARDIYTHAELGYREFRTAEKFVEWMQQFDLPMEKELAVTGVKAILNADKKENFSLALLGEMDALPISDHKFADPVTGAAHCCGHHAQLAAVVGAALALNDPEIKEQLDGQLTFFAVPAEEYADTDYKTKLQNEGKIRFSGGKSQLIYEGAFDDTDLSVVHHLDFDTPYIGNGSSNGFVTKVFRYQGIASHAAVAPEKGVNALAAANIGLHALGVNRETFREGDHIRVHPIITKGGTIVNVIPSEVVVETMVRGGTIDAIEDASAKTDRCFVAGAMAMGANLTIETTPGYLPGIAMPVHPALHEAFQFCEPNKIVTDRDVTLHDTGSSDVGDLQHIMPVINVRTGGMVGGMHQSDFDVDDEEEAYIVPAKAFALMAYRLLKDGAKIGKEIRDGYQPRFASKEEYSAYLETFNDLKTYTFMA